MNEARPDKFVPLAVGAPSTKDRTDFRVTVLRDTPAAAAFQPLNQPHAAAPNTIPGAHAHAHEPQVTLQREGDRVTGIHIQCGCGRMIELGCVY